MDTLIKQPQGQIFKNPFLERLTKSSPSKTIFFYSMLIISFFVMNYRFTANSILVTAGLYLAGIAVWTLMEYILHRWVFHLDEYLPSRLVKRFHYIVHGVHHENPKDEERLFMPPVPGLIIAAALFGFFYLFLGLDALAFMAGITNGYLMYSCIHYHVHAKPVNPRFRKLWTHHALHHYKYHDKAFGVSSPFWDHVFGTMPPKQGTPAQDQ